LSRLASNFNLPSNQDHRCELLCPALTKYVSQRNAYSVWVVKAVSYSDIFKLHPVLLPGTHVAAQEQKEKKFSIFAFLASFTVTFMFL
jgi:hypothetical protein